MAPKTELRTPVLDQDPLTFNGRRWVGISLVPGGHCCALCNLFIAHKTFPAQREEARPAEGRGGKTSEKMR